MFPQDRSEEPAFRRHDEPHVLQAAADAGAAAADGGAGEVRLLLRTRALLLRHTGALLPAPATRAGPQAGAHGECAKLPR